MDLDRAEIMELLRNKPGLAGDTSRVLTEYYFNFCYQEDDLKQSASDLISYRNGQYQNSDLVVPLSSETIDIIIENFSDNISCIFLIFFYVENSMNNEQKELFDEYLVEIYKVISQEHVTIAKKLKMKPIWNQISYEESLILKNITKTHG